MDTSPEQGGVGARLDAIFGGPHGRWHREQGLYIRARSLRLMQHCVTIEGVEIPAYVRVEDMIQDTRIRPSFGFASPSRPPRGRLFTGRTLIIETYRTDRDTRVLNDKPGAMNGSYDLDQVTGELEKGRVQLEGSFVDSGQRLGEFLTAIERIVSQADVAS